MARIINSRKKRILVLTALLALGAAAAYAFWTTSGAGTGSASTGDVDPVAVKQTSAIAGLYPGGPSVTLSGNFDNPNSGAVQVHNVSATLGAVTGGAVDAGKPACTVDDFDLTGFPATVDQNVAAGSGKGSWTTGSGAGIKLKNSAENQDNCKNATVAISYTSN